MHNVPLRVLACGAILAGGLAASVSQGQVTNCSPVFWSPAICTPAHAEAPSLPAGGGDCQLDVLGYCVPSPTTRCQDRYGIAIAGKCTLFLDYNNPTSCTKDYGVTVVDLPKYDAACVNASGTCLCVFTRNTGVPPAQAQVCECLEQAL